MSCKLLNRDDIWVRLISLPLPSTISSLSLHSSDLPCAAIFFFMSLLFIMLINVWLAISNLVAFSSDSKSVLIFNPNLFKSKNLSFYFVIFYFNICICFIEAFLYYFYFVTLAYNMSSFFWIYEDIILMKFILLVYYWIGGLSSTISFNLPNFYYNSAFILYNLSTLFR